jgi:hypothetical protein
VTDAHPLSSWKRADQGQQLLNAAGSSNLHGWIAGIVSCAIPSERVTFRAIKSY